MSVVVKIRPKIGFVTCKCVDFITYVSVWLQWIFSSRLMSPVEDLTSPKSRYFFCKYISFDYLLQRSYSTQNFFQEVTLRSTLLSYLFLVWGRLIIVNFRCYTEKEMHLLLNSIDDKLFHSARRKLRYSSWPKRLCSSGESILPHRVCLLCHSAYSIFKKTCG